MSQNPRSPQKRAQASQNAQQTYAQVASSSRANTASSSTSTSTVPPPLWRHDTANPPDRNLLHIPRIQPASIPSAGPSRLPLPPPGRTNAQASASTPSSSSRYIPPPASGDSPIPGFQTDYERRRPPRRPPWVDVTDGGNVPMQHPRAGKKVVVADIEDAGSAGSSTGVIEGVAPPPEAYLVIRKHKRPRNGWPRKEILGRTPWRKWSYSLSVIQAPDRGKALGMDSLRRGWPGLSPPLVIQMIVHDERDNVIPTDRPDLVKRIAHMVLQLMLVSEDGTEERSLVQERVPTQSTLESDPTHVLKTLLQASVKTPQLLVRNGQKGYFFLFPDLVVRPSGIHAIEARLLDLAGPSHIGTSIGVTECIASIVTSGFTVHPAATYPGSHPVTDISLGFISQGERGLGRQTVMTVDEQGNEVEEEMSDERPDLVSPDLAYPPPGST